MQIRHEAGQGWVEREPEIETSHKSCSYKKNKNKIKYVKRKRITDGLLHVQTSVPI